MARWKALPEELDPQVREFAGQLRRLVDRSGLSIAALADRTGYSKTSWERYLNGRLLAPKGAVVALAEVTRTNPLHLTTMWELAERAWSRSEMRHDMTMEAIRISQARAALGGLDTTKSGAKGGASGAKRGDQAGSKPGSKPGSNASSKAGRSAKRPSAPAQPGVPYGAAGPGAAYGRAQGGGVGAGAGRGAVATPPVPPRGPVPVADAVPAGAAPAERRGRGRTVAWILVGVVGVLAVIAAAFFVPGLLKGDGEPNAKPSAEPSTEQPKLPAGVKCSGADCAGQDPEDMGCGGEFAKTSTSVTLGSALVELRYSKTCGAAWARITLATPGDTVQVTGVGGGSKQRAEVDTDNDAYTPMVAAGSVTDAKACATLKSGLRGCTK
ncbi:XRE family transcriptional regulator [Streptomyces sp. NPDC002851]